MNTLAIFLLLLLQLLNAEFSFSFIKSPFQFYRTHINENANQRSDKLKYFIKNLCNHKNNKEIRKPAILEIPVELDEKWEEGEIPWDFIDTNVTTNNKNNGSNLDANNIAFLFV
jgi:hypothetical protein